jgi:hypothetical protein
MKFACGYIINFNDGGKSEEQVLHIGSLEECQKMEKILSADCKFVIVPLSERG